MCVGTSVSPVSHLLYCVVCVFNSIAILACDKSLSSLKSLILGYSYLYIFYHHYFFITNTLLCVDIRTKMCYFIYDTNMC